MSVPITGYWADDTLGTNSPSASRGVDPVRPNITLFSLFFNINQVF